MLKVAIANSVTKLTKSARHFGIYFQRNAVPSLASRALSTFDKFVAERRNEKLANSFICGPSDVPKLGLTVGQLLQRAANSWGDETALVVRHQKIRKTFDQVLKEADQAAAGLLSLGLKRGDRIAIWGPNSYEWLLALWAAARAGLITVSLNPAYRANELRYTLNQTEAKVLVMAEEFRGQSMSVILGELVKSPDQSSNDGLVSSSLVPSLQRVISLSEKTSMPKALRWSDLANNATLAMASQVNYLQKRIHIDDPFIIQFTSGTTGNPKGATMSHYNAVNSGYMNAIRLGYTETDQIACIPLPMFHTFASTATMMGIAHGAKTVLPSAVYSGRETVKAIQEEKCTMLYGAPAMFVDILHLPDLKEYDLSSLKTTVMGGAPIPLELAKAVVRNLNIKYFQIPYGMTETSGSSFMTKRTDSLETSCSTVGYVSDHHEVKIIDPTTGEILPVNTPGEICTRGYSVMLGYWNQREMTNEVLSKDGWYRTGDLGTLDENGYGRIVGRIKDMIIRGGENIYPREIEELLHTHPDIQEAQVIGVPDPRLGEELCAWIRRKPQSNVSAEELTAFCKERIAYFKVPRYWLFKDSFPMTLSGKPQKFIMRDITVKELGLAN